MTTKKTPKNARGQVFTPDREGRCGCCEGSNFAYSNGSEFAADGTRGYRCVSCDSIKPENWREIVRATYKVGDRVKYSGYHGTITRVNATRGGVCEVRLERGGIAIDPLELEKVEGYSPFRTDDHYH